MSCMCSDKERQLLRKELETPVTVLPNVNIE